MKKPDNASDEKYELRLFVTGASPNSVKAVENIKTICEKYLQGNYELEVIDIYKQPLEAQAQQLIALPLLLKMRPLPAKRLVGDMSDLEKVLQRLGIEDN